MGNINSEEETGIDIDLILEVIRTEKSISGKATNEFEYPI